MISVPKVVNNIMYYKMDFGEFVDRLMEQRITNTRYEVTEDFRKFGKRTYMLMNLDCYYDGGFLFLEDDRGMLDDVCVLHSIDEDNVLDIEYRYFGDTNFSITTLTCSDGYIELKAWTLGM